MTSYQPYVSTSAINKPIPANPPIHPDSAKMISTANDWLLGGTPADASKEWIGPRQRCIYYRGDLSKLPRVDVYVNYIPGTGYRCVTKPISMPMPSWFLPILQGKAPTGISQDRNVILVDTATGDVWETWHLTPPGMASMNVTCSTTRWNAIICNHYPADVVSHTGYDGPLSPSPASASKIHYAAGLLVPEDFADLTVGSVIPHALTLTAHCGSNGTAHPKFVLPARGGDGVMAGGIPYGARVQLDPAIDVAKHTSVIAKPEPWRSGLIKILLTLQARGLILDDKSGGIGTGGLTACHPASVAQGSFPNFKYPWDAEGWSYANGIPYDLMQHFRVIDWTKWTGA
jgi:hypothetical protein